MAVENLNDDALEITHHEANILAFAESRGVRRGPGYWCIESDGAEIPIPDGDVSRLCLRGLLGNPSDLRLEAVIAVEGARIVALDSDVFESLSKVLRPTLLGKKVLQALDRKPRSRHDFNPSPSPQSRRRRSGGFGKRLGATVKPKMRARNASEPKRRARSRAKS
jgi:hypothetical protein